MCLKPNIVPMISFLGNTFIVPLGITAQSTTQTITWLDRPTPYKAPDAYTVLDRPSSTHNSLYKLNKVDCYTDDYEHFFAALADIDREEKCKSKTKISISKYNKVDAHAIAE